MRGDAHKIGNPIRALWNWRRRVRFATGKVFFVTYRFLLFALGASFLVACASTRLPGDAAPRAEVQRSTNVTELYERNCGNCHGMNAEGGGGGTKSLLSEEKFDPKWDRPFFDAIKNGVEDAGMEAYGDSLTDPQIWALVVHIREMQARYLRQKNGSPKATNGVYRSKHHAFRIETVVDRGEIETPWAIDWLPDRRMLVTSRPGPVYLVDKGKAQAIEGIPDSAQIGQGGMMDVAVHPDYAKNGWIYLAFTDPAQGKSGGMTKIVRGRLSLSSGKPRWTDQQTIFQCAPDTYTTSSIHFGCRIVFDGKGHVYFPIGERGNGSLAQDLSKPNGKVFRVLEDGSIPKDNPFVSDKSALPAIWSYGHRNPQGLIFDLEGNLWDTEHGPRGGDEVNRIERGANYGWPLVAFSINYNDTPLVTPWPKPDQKFVMPVYRWLPSIGACGLDVVRGSGFPNWKGDLLAGGLSGANVDRLRIKGGKLVEREEIVHGLGRVREVAYGPDGHVYIALNQPDKIIRLVQADR